MLQPSSSGVMHASQGACTGRDKHASTQERRARKRTVRAVRAGASSSWSHFDALSLDTSGARGRLRRYSKAPVSADTLYCRRCCRRFPGGPNRPRAAAGIRGSRWGRGAERLVPISRFAISIPLIKGRTLGFCPRNGHGAKSRIYSRNIKASKPRDSAAASPPRNCGCCSSGLRALGRPTSRRKNPVRRPQKPGPGAGFLNPASSFCPTPLWRWRHPSLYHPQAAPAPTPPFRLLIMAAPGQPSTVAPIPPLNSDDHDSDRDRDY